MISKTPARIMGIDDRKGTLTIGKDADVLVFDQEINIQHTIVGGKIIYSRI
ncbi:isoaspartyl dipeptidase [compost metagenome]